MSNQKITVHTPKGTPITITRTTEEGRYVHTATLEHAGQTYRGEVYKAIALRSPRDGATHYLPIGKASVGIEPADLSALEAFLAERPARTEADIARDRVRDAAAAVEAAESASYYDPARICRARQALEAAEAEWRKSYPGAAAEADAQARKDRASHLRHLAAQALTYDADGWLSAAEQQRRHDAYMAEAANLEAS